MAARLQVRLYDHSGTLFNILDGWRSLSLQLGINNFSTHTLALDEPRAQIDWPKDTFVQVLRSDPAVGLGWYQTYMGFHRTPQHEITEAGNRIFTSYGRSIEDLLHRRFILYGGGSPQAFKGPLANGVVGLPADDIMKAYVRENIGELADAAPPRFQAGRIPEWVTTADASQAPLWSGDRAYKNLLDVLQEIGHSLDDPLLGVDFRVQMLTMSPPIFVFETAYPMFGVDHTVLSPPLTFSDVQDNISNISYTRSATEEVNSVLVAGTGLGDLRNFAVIENLNAIAESPWNKIESTRSDAGAGSVTALQRYARNLLNSLGAQESFKFTPRQTNLAVFGRDYNLGDRMYVQLGTTRRAKRLVGVNINSSGEGAEQLTFEFGDYRATGKDPFESALRFISTRMNYMEFEGDL